MVVLSVSCECTGRVRGKREGEQERVYRTIDPFIIVDI